jgi:hypothetical protein
MMNPNWLRWIAASIGDHFDVSTPNLPMYVEGQHRDTSKLKDFFELRLVEQNSAEKTRGDWTITCDVNCLVHSTKDDKDNHRIYKSCGLIAAAFTAIPVFKYGDGPDDDDSFLGCLTLKQDLARKELVEVTHFGQVDKACEVVQSMIEGMYCIELTN